jgi:hypothetical protein
MHCISQAALKEMGIEAGEVKRRGEDDVMDRTDEGE